mmetsp:Transcript_154573/g.273002  ORF Transcript_154573/g.273002 Transcript_154573/m.273002 type:complete len:100 (-) Transcript_154573:1069-1368(-)
MATKSLFRISHDVSAESARNFLAVLRKAKLEEMANNIAAKLMVTKLLDSRIQDFLEKLSSGTFREGAVLQDSANNAAAKAVTDYDPTRAEQLLHNETGP